MSMIWPVQVALYDAIVGDATLAGLLQGERVYSLSVPETDDALPYVLFAQSTESTFHLFGTEAYAGHESLAVWSADRTKWECAKLCDHLVRVLNHQPLTLAGGHYITGELTILAIALDPSLKYSRANLAYEVLSYV